MMSSSVAVPGTEEAGERSAERSHAVTPDGEQVRDALRGELREEYAAVLASEGLQEQPDGERTIVRPPPHVPIFTNERTELPVFGSLDDAIAYLADTRALQRRNESGEGRRTISPEELRKRIRHGERFIMKMVEKDTWYNQPLPFEKRRDIACRLLYGASWEEAPAEARDALAWMEGLQQVPNPAGPYGSYVSHAKALIEQLGAHVREPETFKVDGADYRWKEYRDADSNARTRSWQDASGAEVREPALCARLDDALLAARRQAKETRKIFLKLDLVGARDQRNVLAEITRRAERPVNPEAARHGMLGVGAQGRVMRLEPRDAEANRIVAKWDAQRDTGFVAKEAAFFRRASDLGVSPRRVANDREDLALLMEYEEGARTLDTVLREINDTRRQTGAPSRERVAQLGERLANQLATLHAAGIVHRDIKPGNILQRADGTPLLIDFGLSREVPPGQALSTQDLEGTPPYMAPEMCQARPVISEKNDVYALGCILFEMYTGKRWITHFAEQAGMDAGTPEAIMLAQQGTLMWGKHFKNALRLIDDRRVREAVGKLLDPSQFRRPTAAEAVELLQECGKPLPPLSERVAGGLGAAWNTVRGWGNGMLSIFFGNGEEQKKQPRDAW